MTTISAKVIADSFHPGSPRLVTMQLRYPRWIHAEGRTHRRLKIGEEWPTPSLMEDENLSRNASSSRAIPVEQLIQDVLNDPAVPLYWGRNQRGMQAFEELTGADLEAAKSAFNSAVNSAIQHARFLSRTGVHKQIVNRVLEPFSHINVVVTATEWENFFALRRHKDAEPHIHMLADAMWLAMKESFGEPKATGDWHLPYVTQDDLDKVWADANLIQMDPKRAQSMTILPTLRKLSVARCARVSYLTHEGKQPDIYADLALYGRLVGGVPLHASPAEHQATPDPHGVREGQWGNFRGWVQYRKTLPNENAQGATP